VAVNLHSCHDPHERFGAWFITFSNRANAVWVFFANPQDYETFLASIDGKANTASKSFHFADAESLDLVLPPKGIGTCEVHGLAHQHPRQTLSVAASQTMATVLGAVQRASGRGGCALAMLYGIIESSPLRARK